MRIVIIKDSGEQIDVPVGGEVVVDGIRVSAQEAKEPTFYDPVDAAPGASGGGAGE